MIAFFGGGGPVPDPSSSGGDASDDGDVDIVGFVMSMTVLAGFFFIVDRLSEAMGIPTLLSVPVALVVCGAALYVTVLAVALPFIAHDYCSTRTRRRLCIALVIATAGLAGIILTGLVAGFAVLL